MKLTEQTVCILLCTFNGGAHLSEQLQSIENQTHLNWVVYASDDGSNDNTVEILKNFQAKWGVNKLIIKKGPQRGFCANFLSLAQSIEQHYEFYAFCDQDDVWKPRKLQHAIHKIDWNSKNDQPKLYCGRTIIVNQNLKVIGLSPKFIKSPSFRNALVQSLAGGNTMIFNQAALLLLKKANVREVVSHDWWLYQLVSGSDGYIYYDVEPLILYRQHNNSLIGANISLYAQFQRVSQAFNNRYKRWNELNTTSLVKVKYLFASKNQNVLHQFQLLRTEKSALRRMFILRKMHLYRQTGFETFKLWVACLLNKL